MAKSKNGLAFFDMLDDEQKRNFTESYEAQNSDKDSVSINDYMSMEFPNFVTFLSKAFLFTRATPDGNYWDNIINNSPDGLTIEQSVVGIIEYSLDKIFSDEDEAESYIIGKEFYDLMNREERTEFHSEFTNQRSESALDSYLNESHFLSFKEFIQSAFVYSESKRGVEYWRSLADKYSFDEVYNTLGELNITTDGNN